MTSARDVAPLEGGGAAGAAGGGALAASLVLSESELEDARRLRTPDFCNLRTLA